MSYDPGNPYTSPAAPPPPPGPPSGSLQFTEAFSYIFRNPNWLMNVILPAVCVMIPLVGPIVVLGYFFDVVEALHRNRGQTYPDFDFNRFGYYLQRGLWPFLAVLVAMCVVMPVIGICLVSPIMCLGIGKDAGALIAVAFLFSLLVLMVMSVAASLAIIPLQLRSGLMQDFTGAFSFEFIKDFIARTWLEILLQALFMWVAGGIITTAGMILCFIGIFPAAMIVMLARAHFRYQLYEIYLSRGGEPIPLMPTQPM